MEVNRIDEVFAFVVVDPLDNTEGIPSLFTGQGWAPMVAADRERVESLRPRAEGLAKRLGLPITLLRFTNREEMEVIEP